MTQIHACVHHLIQLSSLDCFLHHRVCGKMSGSNMELDRCSQQGSVESPTSSLRGLGSASLPTASTDSLTVDTGEYNQVKGIYLSDCSTRNLHSESPVNLINLSFCSESVLSFLAIKAALCQEWNCATRVKRRKRVLQGFMAALRQLISYSFAKCTFWQGRTTVFIFRTEWEISTNLRRGSEWMACAPASGITVILHIKPLQCSDTCNCCNFLGNVVWRDNYGLLITREKGLGYILQRPFFPSSLQSFHLLWKQLLEDWTAQLSQYLSLLE